ncbi:hypothetical protein MKW92_024591, partial [Papaver armeniacum]
MKVVSCNSKLVAEGDDLDSNKLREMLKQKVKQQLKPLVKQLENVKDLTCPEFCTLQAWEMDDAAVKEEDIKPN